MGLEIRASRVDLLLPQACHSLVKREVHFLLVSVPHLFVTIFTFPLW